MISRTVRATRTTSSRNSLRYGLGMMHILSLRHLPAPQFRCHPAARQTHLENRLPWPEQIAEVLGVLIGTLANWRYQERGPAFAKVGRHVPYRRRRRRLDQRPCRRNHRIVIPPPCLGVPRSSAVGLQTSGRRLVHHR